MVEEGPEPAGRTYSSDFCTIMTGWADPSGDGEISGGLLMTVLNSMASPAGASFRCHPSAPAALPGIAALRRDAPWYAKIRAPGDAHRVGAGVGLVVA